MFVLSSPENRYTHFETLYYENKNYILIILLKITQQTIQSQRFNKVSTTLKRVLKNMIKWSDSNLHTNLTKYITDHQEYTNNDTDKERNKLINQGVKKTNDQYYITHQKLILSNTVSENDIYDNWGALGEPVSVFRSQCIKFKAHIFLFKKRTSTTSESKCLCPIVVQF